MQTSLPGHIIHITCWYFQTQYSLFLIQGKTKSSSITCLIVCSKHSGLRTVERMPSAQGQHAGCFYAVFAQTFPFSSHKDEITLEECRWENNMTGRWCWWCDAFASGTKWVLSVSHFYTQIKNSSWLIYFYHLCFFYISVSQYLLPESIY